MVYITDDEGTVRKFACLTCIKGHRSSGCQHADRELVEIRKKGRPLTQCAHCRNLRRTKQVHIKCMCHKKSDVLSSLSPTTAAVPATNTATPAPTSVNASTTTASSNTSTSFHSMTPDNQHIDLTQQDMHVQNLLSKPCARCDRSPSYCICTFESRSNQVDYGYLSSGSSDGTVTPPAATITSAAVPYSNFDLHHRHHYNAIPSSSSSSSSSSPTSSTGTTSATTSNTTTNGHSLRLVIPSNNPVSETAALDPRPSTTATIPFDQHSESSSAASSRHGSPFTSTSCFSSTKASPSSHQPSHRPPSLSSPAGLHSIIPIHDPTDDLDSDTPIYKSEEQAIDQSAVLGELTNRTSEELMNQIYNGFSAQTYRIAHPPLDFVTDEPEDDDHPVISRTSSAPSTISSHQQYHHDQSRSSSVISSSSSSPMPPASP